MRNIKCTIIIAMAGLISITSGVDGADIPVSGATTFGWGGYYRPGQWTPVNVDIHSKLAQPFEGTLVISGAQDDLNNLEIYHTVVVTPGVVLRQPLVTKLAYNLDSCRVRLMAPNGQVYWRDDVDFWNTNSGTARLNCVGGDDFLLGVIGRRQFGIGDLEKQLACLTANGTGQVYVGNELPKTTPWDWTGYDSLDALILFDPDWTEFKDEQCRAIGQWVSKGGKLGVILGSNPLPMGHPFRQWLPAAFDRPRQLKPDWAYLADMKLDHTESIELDCYNLQPRDASVRFDRRFDVFETNVLAAAPVGFGRVAMLGFSPANLSPKQRNTSHTFWLWYLGHLLKQSAGETAYTTAKTADGPGIPGMLPGGGMPHPTIRTTERLLVLSDSNAADMANSHSNYYAAALDQLAANRVMEHLLSIEELRPLSLGWVILMLATLAILLGPVDYLVLKRRDQLPLTWLTMAGWIALFTVAAYYGVEALRAGNLQVRVVSLIDAAQSSPDVWRTSYAGIFAPHSDEYLLENIRYKNWWSGIAPSRERMYGYYSRQQSTAMRKITCVQTDGTNVPVSVPINIWSMQCLLREDTPPDVPLRAEVARRGDRVEVRITNLSDQSIRKGYVLFNNQRALAFARVNPQQSQTFSGELKYSNQYSWAGATPGTMPIDSNDFDQQIWRELGVAAGFAQGALSRTAGILRDLDDGKALVCVEIDNAPIDFTVADKDYDIDHVCWCRLLVTPAPLTEGTTP